MKRGDWQESKYITKHDVEGKRLNLVIDSVVLEAVDPDEDKRKPVAYFAHAKKGMVLNNTNWSILEALYGEDSDGWEKKKVALYVDPSVTYMGKRTGGLRMAAPDTAPEPEPAAEPPPLDDGDEPPF